jgi:LEA14-like dessication related protein
MRNLLFILSALLLTVSCSFHEPVLKGGEKFNLEKIDGQTIHFNAGANIENENWFGLKVKPSKFELYVDGDYMGIVSLDKKIKIKRKSDAFVEGKFTGNLEKGSLMKAMTLVGKSEISVRLKGKAKGGVFIFSKKFDIDETKTIPGSMLKMGR